MNKELIEKLNEERTELAAKIDRLENALCLGGFCGSQNHLLMEQRRYMTQYRNVLVERIIDLRRKKPLTPQTSYMGYNEGASCEPVNFEQPRATQ